MSEARGIAVIIVNYKTAAMVADCLATLLPQLKVARCGAGEPPAEPGADGWGDEVVIVDNASGEKDLVELRKLAGPGVRIIESAKNLGFAGANNVGMGEARAARAAAGGPGFEFWMWLNPDTYLRAGAVAGLLGFLRERPDVDCVGPRLEYPDGRAQLSAFVQATPLSELIRGANIGVISRMLKRWAVYGEIRNEPHATDWLAGACVLMRHEMLNRVGHFDAGYFMYFEEVDFFRRAARAKCKVWYFPAARVVHLVGQSSGIDSGGKWVARRLPDYWFESRHRYFRKHFGLTGMIAADGLWLMGHALMRVRQAFTGVSNSAVAKSETADFLRHSVRQLTRPGIREAV